MRKEKPKIPITDSVTGKWEAIGLLQYLFHPIDCARLLAQRATVRDYLKSLELGLFDNRSWDANMEMLNYFGNFLEEASKDVFGKVDQSWRNRFAIALRLRDVEGLRKDLPKVSYAEKETISQRISHLEQDILLLQGNMMKHVPFYLLESALPSSGK